MRFKFATAPSKQAPSGHRKISWAVQYEGSCRGGKGGVSECEGQIALCVYMYMTAKMYKCMHGVCACMGICMSWCVCVRRRVVIYARVDAHVYVYVHVRDEKQPPLQSNCTCKWTLAPACNYIVLYVHVYTAPNMWVCMRMYICGVQYSG